MRRIAAMTRSFGLRQALAGLTVVFFAAVPARADLNIVEVTSSKGIKALLVEDQSDPMVSMSFAFSGGSVQDPDGKEGATELLSTLLTKGAGDLDSDEFQEELYKSGADLSFAAEQEKISGTLRMLASDTKKPLELLSLALASPRFDETPLERERAVLSSSIQEESNDPDALGKRELIAKVFGDSPYGRMATVETVGAIGRNDMVELHRKMLARSNLYIGVVGAIDPQTLAGVLDKVFGDLPAKDGLAKVGPPAANFGVNVFQRSDQPQSSISLVYPGVGSRSEDYYAAVLANDVLGGNGGMNSRLFVNLREKRGLTYAADSGFSLSRDWGTWGVVTTTRAEHTNDALQLARDVVKRLADEGPTPKELEDAKKYEVGSYVVNNLSSTTAISSTLATIQEEGLGIDYPQRIRALFEGVTLDQVKEVAKRLLSVEPAVLVVGPEKG